MQRHNKRFKWAVILGFTIETNMMWFQSQGSWKYLVKNVKYFCSFGNSKRPVKVWLVLKSVSLPKVQQRVFCWRHHNTKLIRRHAPGISVDLKGEGLWDFRVVLSQPLKAISKWPKHLAKFLNFSLSSDISSYNAARKRYEMQKQC